MYPSVRYVGGHRFVCVFFFQAEDGIRDHCVTGVQTCALPISADDIAEQEEVDVTIDKALAGRLGWCFVRRTTNRLFSAAEFELELEVGTQARRVRQQMSDRDRLLAVDRKSVV